MSWFVGRRQRDVDMLSQLQSSINLLSKENKEILAENVQLRKENAGLRVSQEELIAEVAHLGKEVERLRKIINTLNKQLNRDETSQRGCSVSVARGSSTRGDGLRNDKNCGEAERGDRGERVGRGARTGARGALVGGQCDGGFDGAVDTDREPAGECAGGDPGAGCGGEGECECEREEPG